MISTAGQKRICHLYRAKELACLARIVTSDDVKIPIDPQIDLDQWQTGKAQVIIIIVSGRDENLHADNHYLPNKCEHRAGAWGLLQFQGSQLKRGR